MSLVVQARGLIEQGRAEEALTLLEAPAQAPAAPLDVQSARALALKRLGRLEEALSAYQAAAVAYPTSAVTEHNIASAMGDLHRHAESVAHARLAQAKGLDAPETWLVLGRSLQGLARLDEADAAFRAALARRPNYADALRDLSQLIWMRTGDLASASAPLDAALRDRPDDLAPAMLKARLLRVAERPDAAYALLMAARGQAGPIVELEIAASALAAALDRPEAALEHAQLAARLPGGDGAGLLVADAWLALGRPEAAAAEAERLLTLAPDDQSVLATLATAWRLLGDPRYAQFYDYDAFVGAYTLDTPPGWPDLPTYLGDLARALDAAHGFSAHPFDQSLRGGTQTGQDLRRSDDPAIAAFFTAIDGPIRHHVARLGHGLDPHRRRNTGAFAVAGAWSVRLQPRGFHVDHVHPLGWLSSACYLRLPDAVAGEGRAGWIKFGEPGVRTRPPLGPEHFVRPEPGLLVLFPSYMWHGTVPFGGTETRLTAAFDVVPG